MFAAAAVTVVMVPLAQALPINFFLHPLGSPHVHLMSREASAQILVGSMITQMHAAIVVPVVMVPLAQALPDYFLSSKYITLPLTLTEALQQKVPCSWKTPEFSALV